MEIYKQLKTNNPLKSIQVYESLKEDLILGQWDFNENIHVNSLIEQFQVSRRPVMEALKMLEKDGFIEIVPQYGCRVISYSKKSAIEVLRLRSALELLCVELAIQNGTDLEMLQFELFHKVTSEQPELLRDKFNYLNYNREFHAHIISMAKSPIITEYVLQIWGLNDFYLVKLFNYFKWDLKQSLIEHQSLVNQMKQRDVIHSKLILEEHFNSFMQQHLENLPN